MADNLLISNYSTRNIFIWNNRYNTLTDTYTNSSGSTVTLTAGMLMGRIAASGVLKQCISTATDGSQFPIGILSENWEIPNGESRDITICIQGDVDYGMLVFGGSPADTISSVVSLVDSATNTVKVGTLGDILIRGGILPINTNEMTYQDNQ